MLCHVVTQSARSARQFHPGVQLFINVIIQRVSRRRHSPDSPSLYFIKRKFRVRPVFRKNQPISLVIHGADSQPRANHILYIGCFVYNRVSTASARCFGKRQIQLLHDSIRRHSQIPVFGEKSPVKPPLVAGVCQCRRRIFIKTERHIHVNRIPRVRGNV